MKMLEDLGTSPAPWTATVDADGRVVVNDENRHGIAACGHTAEGDVDFANARIIAAAPELYEVLRLVLKTIDALGFKSVVESDPLALAVKCGEKALEKAGGAE